MQLKHVVTDATLRLFSTEVIANGSLASLNYLQSIAWQIVRNTNTVAGTYSTMLSDDRRTGERLTVLYHQVLYAYMLICR